MKGKLSITVFSLHVAAAAFAAIVFGLACAAVADRNKVMVAVNNAQKAALAAEEQAGLVAQQQMAAYEQALRAIGNRNRRLLQLPAVMHTTSDTASVGNFLVFVSLSGLLWNLFFMTAHCAWQAVPRTYDATLGKLTARSPAWARAPFYEMVIAAAWFIIWLAGAAAVTSNVFGVCYGSYCGRVNAMLAFSWLSWLSWTILLAIHATEYGVAMRRAMLHRAAGPEKASAPCGGVVAEVKSVQDASATTDSVKA